MTDVSRVGLVGLGFISPYHAAGIRECAPGAEIIGVDSNEQARRQSELRGVVSGTLGSVKELIAAAPQVVHVLTPPDAHAAIAVPLLEAGIDVFLEKPLAHRPEAGEQISNAAQRSGARVGVGHSQLFYSTWERARALLAEGHIGQVRQVDVVARKPLGFLWANDVRPWVMRGSTNVLFEVAPHAFAQLLDVVPEGDVEVHSVRTGSVQRLPNGVEFYRQWDVLGSAADIGVRISLSYEEAFAESSIAIRGTLGSILVDFEHNTLVAPRRSSAAFDVEPVLQSVGTAASILAGAAASFARVVAGKAGVRRLGSEYATSIRRSIACFYEARKRGAIDPRHALALGRRVVSLASHVADASGRQVSCGASTGAAAATPAPRPSREPQVFVVGGTGFIGAEFVRQLATREPVRVVARNVAKAQRQFAGLEVDVVPGDVRDTDGLMRHVTPATAVFHLVFGRGSTWRDLEETDVRPAIALADACLARGVERFVYTSSIAIYDAGRRNHVITESTPANRGVQRVAPYARSKVVVEQHLMKLHRDRGFPVTIVRPGIVLGRQSDPVHWGVAAWPYPNVAVHWGSGRHPLPIVLVEDVAAALVLLRGANGVSGESFNLAAPGCITAEDYLEELSRASGSRLLRTTRPAPSLYLGAIGKWLLKLPSRSGAPFPSYADCRGRSFASPFDCSKAIKLLGWSPVSDRADLLHRAVTEPAKDWAR